MDLLQLPVDILINIFKKLKLSDLHNVMLTCKALKNLIGNDNTIWRSVCRNRLILHQSNSHEPKLSWYHHCRISHNWCSGYYKTKVLIHQYTNYMPWVVFHNSEALVLSVGAELHCYPKDKKGLPCTRERLWKLDVPKIERHDVRTNDISRFIVKDKWIVCGNRDGCVAVYKFNELYRKPKLQSHIVNCHQHGQVEVSAVELIKTNHKTVVVTGSNGGSHVKLWDLSSDETDNHHRTRDRYHNNAADISLSENTGVRCMAMNNEMNKLAIGLNGNSKPLLLDVNTGQLLTSDSTKDAKQAVRDTRWHGVNNVAYVTHSGTLRLMDTRSHQLIYGVRDPFQSTLYCVKTDGENAIMVGSAEYSRCVLFDSRNCKNHVQMYFTQKKTSPVYSLDFDTTKLITAVDKGVAVLNFNVNTSTLEPRDYSHVFN